MREPKRKPTQEQRRARALAVRANRAERRGDLYRAKRIRAAASIA